MKSETTIFVTQPQEADNDLFEEENCTNLSNRGWKLLCAEAGTYRQGATLQVNRK